MAESSRSQHSQGKMAAWIRFTLTEVGPGKWKKMVENSNGDERQEELAYGQKQI